MLGSRAKLILDRGRGWQGLEGYWGQWEHVGVNEGLVGSTGGLGIFGG